MGCNSHISKMVVCIVVHLCIHSYMPMNTYTGCVYSCTPMHMFIHAYEHIKHNGDNRLLNFPCEVL